MGGVLPVILAARSRDPSPGYRKFFRAGPQTPLLPRLREKFPFELATRKLEAARFDLAGNQSAESIPPGAGHGPPGFLVDPTAPPQT